MTNEELNSLQSEAYDHLWHGRHRLALNSAVKLCEFRPNDSEAVICAAWAYLENGNPLKALEFANLAVELKGDSSRTRFFRAYLLTRMSIYEGAIADIEKNINKEKELISWTLLTKARAYAGLKKFEEALKAFEEAQLIEKDKDPSLGEQKKWFIKAKKVFAKNFQISNENIDSFFNDGQQALKAKEYWFALLTAQKILSQDKFKKEKLDAQLLEIEAMYYMFQYRPAYQKALPLKNKFKSNEKFNLIFNALEKFVLAEEEEFEKEIPTIRRTKTDLSYEHLDLSSSANQVIHFNSEQIFYPNDYADLFSIKIFDSLKDSRIHVRNFYKHVNKNMPSIGVEVIFNNRLYGRVDKLYNCDAVWYLNDFEISRNNFKLNIPKDWDSVIFAQSIGSDKSGIWNAGQAKVEIYINNFKIGERTFGIGDTSLPEEEMVIPAPPQKIKHDTTIDSSKTAKVQTRSLDELLHELDSYIGLNNIKQTVRDFISYLKFISERKKHGLKTDDKISINAIFLGNPGTGKTTIARLLGEILRAMGILPSGHVIEVDRSGLVGQYIGETAQKTEKIINDSVGGVLFIDEAYSLIKKGGSGQDFGQEAIDILLKRMEDKKGEFVVIAAGYTDEMNAFLNSNPGLKSRFTHTFIFEDYIPQELFQILKLNLLKEEYILSNSAEELLKKEFIKLYRARDKSFGNARLVKNILDEAKINLSRRVVSLAENKRTKEILNTINEDDVKQILQKTTSKKFILTINEEGLAEALNELDNLVGLENVKKEIYDLVKLARYFAEQGEDLREKFGNHYLFLGNPGTGKTTVARIFSKIFSSLGVLSKGHLVETDRQGLVAGFVGQTAEKTTALIDKAFGGTLFIDEAYALIKGDSSSSDFGKEAIDILLKRMEDERYKFIVIAAGYTDEMKIFIASNPGMQSRFSKSITFDDYSPKDLMEIVYRTLNNDKKKISQDAEETLLKHFNELYRNRDKKFGNARIVRNILESVKQKMLLRIADIPQSERNGDTLNTIVLSDIKDAIEIRAQANEYQVKGDPLKLQEYIDQLSSLVGLEKVKESVFKLISGSKIAQLKRERGLLVIQKNYNALLIGNDGTGKTTVAKLISKILKELGVLEKGHLIEVKRADLIGAYPEQTILKTEDIIRDAVGGTLFIEDAFTLIQEENDNGLIVLDTICRKIDLYREKLVVFLEGPEENIINLIKEYPAIKDKFPHRFEFEDYNPRNLLSIAYEIAKNHGYFLDEGALQVLLEIFTELDEKHKLESYNSKAAKNILYSAISNQEQRILSMLNPSDNDLKIITLEDVEAVKF
ncbi:MAG: AAA family ATPase [Melioribacteraceae bacterium]|nr:AAA family ATPase [Melioribacteraceae bacterium]